MSTGAGADRRIERSRAAITAAAIDLFTAHGFAGTNIDDVADRAGVSKKTIYNVFGGKEQLFRDIVEQAIQTAEGYSADTAAALTRVPEVEPNLRDAVVQLAQAVLAGQVIPIRRLLIAEVERFPELAQRYYSRAPGLVMRTLATTLARLAALGKLDVADADVAAEQLAFLVLGPGMDRALFRASGSRVDTTTEIEARANIAFDAFLAIYRH